MSGIYETWLDLPAPDGDDIYSAKGISEFNLEVHICRTLDERPVVLIAASPNEIGQGREDLYLRTRFTDGLVVAPMGTDDRVSIGNVLSIELKDTNKNLAFVFLDFIYQLLEHSGCNTASEFLLHIETLQRLLSSADASPSKSTQGLWAELFAILNIAEVQFMVDAWQIGSSELHDFSQGRHRLEVKSTKQDSRVHWFNWKQLFPESDVDVTVASVQLHQSTRGPTVGDLRDLILDSLPANSHNDFHDKYGRRVGRDFEDCSQTAYDEDFALFSMSLLPSKQVLPDQVHSSISPLLRRGSGSQIENMKVQISMPDVSSLIIDAEQLDPWKFER